MPLKIEKAEELYDFLKEKQEKQGYYFNPALADITMPLLESLITNRKRYGYMSCPCRLASGSMENDKDILCPCLYREPDVKEFGSCYCGLYLSKEEAENHGSEILVPERRPAERALWFLKKA